MDLNPTPWTPEPYTLWLRFVLEWLMVCGVLCGVCGVLCGVCGVRCMCYGPCRRAGLVDGRVLMSQAWRQSRRRDRVVALVVGRVVSVGRSCRRRRSGASGGEEVWRSGGGGGGGGGEVRSGSGRRRWRSPERAVAVAKSGGLDRLTIDGGGLHTESRAAPRGRTFEILRSF